MASYTNSIDKIVGTYFAAVSRAPFTYKGVVYAPRPLRVYPSIVRSHDCPPDCAACCQIFTLDYLPDEEKPANARPEWIEFNGSRYLIHRISPESTAASHCQYVGAHARCEIHGTHPFSCDFEPVRVEIGVVRNYNMMGVEHYGRKQAFTRITGESDVLCVFGPPTSESISDVVRKLRRLKDWTDHFQLTDTWIPDILEYIEDGQWARDISRDLLPGGWTEALRSSQDLSAAKERVIELVEDARYTRKEIMARLTGEFPEIKKSSLADMLTDAKSPKIKRLGRLVIIDDDGIWKFQ